MKPYPLADVLLSRDWRSIWREYRLDVYAGAMLLVYLVLGWSVCELIVRW